MKKLTIVMMALLLSLSFASAYNMSEDVSLLQEEVQTFDWENSFLTDFLGLVYKLLTKVIVQDAIIQELSLRPVSCSCGGGSGSQPSAPVIEEQVFTPNPDVNGDGCVNTIDEIYVTHNENWGRNDCVESDWCSGFDINHDGKIGQTDLDYVLDSYDVTCPAYQTDIDKALENII